MNKLYQRYGSPQQQQANHPGIQNGPFESMNQFLDNFGKFSQAFTGNPDQRLQAMLESGEMSQQQYNACYGLAKKIMGCMQQRR